MSTPFEILQNLDSLDFNIEDRDINKDIFYLDDNSELMLTKDIPKNISETELYPPVKHKGVKILASGDRGNFDNYIHDESIIIDTDYKVQGYKRNDKFSISGTRKENIFAGRENSDKYLMTSMSRIGTNARGPGDFRPRYMEQALERPDTYKRGHLFAPEVVKINKEHYFVKMGKDGNLSYSKTSPWGMANDFDSSRNIYDNLNNKKGD